jgi:hypothetical protein
MPAEPPALCHGLPPIDHTGGHKPSQYHPRLGQVICARIEAGETVRQVAADPAMPSYATIFHWRKMHPDFDARYAAMRARMAKARIEAADLAARSKVYWRIHKARVDGRRPRDWVAGKKSTYRRDWAQAYCDRIAAGESGMSVSADPAMPSAKAVYGWLKRFPEFREMYVAARRAQQFSLELDIHLAADEVLDGRASLADGKRAVARLEGRIGRLGPKTWKAVPPERVWAEPPGGGMRPARKPSS